MIGKIKGKLNEIEGNLGLIETQGGVFYNVFLTPKTLSRYKVNDNFEVYTYMQVREDAMVLFGFETKKEYEFFKLLLTVSGVGPKTAFSIISFIKIDDLISAIKNNDINVLTQVPGLGKKTAMKIILELSSKMDADFELKNLVLSSDDKVVVDALISLGFKSIDAKKILNGIPKDLSIEEKITFALKKISKK
ncbi:MAG: Holliday junction branch migration protein RuvA [Candidatus Microgenomates bacterium]